MRKTARKGVGMWTIEAQGIASHARLNPEAGASAILELARQTDHLHSLSDPGSNTSFNVGVVRGVTRSNVVAAQAEIEVEARRVEELMSTLKPFDDRVQLKVKGGINRAPLERTPGVVKAFRACSKSLRCWNLISVSFRQAAPRMATLRLP
jgi:glutamate carboxypeptidase